MVEQSDPQSGEPRTSEPRDATIDEARLRQQALGSKLRQMFNDVVNEPVPEEFLDILRRGDRKSNGGE